MDEDPVDRDAELHARIISGEEEAVAEWEREYRDRLFRYAMRKGLPPEDAEDAFSDAFFATIKRAASLEGPLGLSLRKHAFAVVANKIADFHRRRTDDPVSLDRLIEEGKDDPAIAAPHSTRPDERIVEAIRRCMQAIRGSYRILLELLYYEELPVDVVAERLGVEVNTVYKTKGRAITRIKPCLEEALGVHS
jgi:RNA polymerase sigma factor (sigma-70 family)